MAKEIKPTVEAYNLLQHVAALEADKEAFIKKTDEAIQDTLPKAQMLLDDVADGKIIRTDDGFRQLVRDINGVPRFIEADVEE